MAAHLVIIACLVAPPSDCKEFLLPDVTAEDVSSCIGKAAEPVQKWQEENQDKLVIGTKCVKTQ